MAGPGRRTRLRPKRVLLGVLGLITAGWLLLCLPWLITHDATQLAAVLGPGYWSSRLWPAHSRERSIQPHKNAPSVASPQKISLSARLVLPGATQRAQQAQQSSLDQLALQVDQISADAHFMYNSRVLTEPITSAELVEPAFTRTLPNVPLYPSHAAAVLIQQQQQPGQGQQQQPQQGALQATSVGNNVDALATRPQSSTAQTQQQQKQAAHEDSSMHIPQSTTPGKRVKIRSQAAAASQPRDPSLPQLHAGVDTHSQEVAASTQRQQQQAKPGSQLAASDASASVNLHLQVRKALPGQQSTGAVNPQLTAADPQQAQQRPQQAQRQADSGMDGPRLRQTGPDPRAGQKGRVDGAAAGVDPLDPLDSLEPDGEGDGMQTLHAYDPLSVVDALKQAREADFEHLQEHAEEEAVIAEAEYKRQEQLRKEQRKKELEAKRQKKERMREKAERKAREAAAAEEMRIKSEAMLADKARLDAYYATPEFQEQRAANWDRAGRPGRTRGIVIPSGGSVLLHHAFVTIKMLREVHNCTLPIQIIYNGPNEMGPKKIAKFQNAFSDVTCIDGSKVPYPKHHRRIDLGTRKSEDSVDDESHKDVSGFAFKIWALVYATTFDEVLMLDSDNMPLREPSYLFETREYRMHGALFFPDWWEKGWVKAEAYTMFGLEVPWTLKPKYVTSESGQLLLDRNQHFDVLEWLWFLNSHQNVTYKLMYGDKDTFRLAFNLAGKKRDFKQVTIPPCAPLDANPLNKPPTVFLHVGMMQHDPYGNVAFLHRTAEGKFYAFGKGFRKVDYVSVPLSPKRAKGCLHKTMGYSAKQIDTGTFAQCPVADPKTFHKECKLNIRSPDFPIPVIPVGEIPELSGVLEASNAMFRQIQKEYKDSLLADRERLSRRHMLA